MAEGFDQGGSSSLRDNLLVLPRWAAFGAVGVLLAGTAIGATLLLAPGDGEQLQGAGAQVLAISLPSLAFALGVLGTARARTSRIDALVARYLRGTMASKFRDYLVGSKPSASGYLPPMFVRLETDYRPEVASFCMYHLFDAGGRRFDASVKTNLFNFEVNVALRFAPGSQPEPVERTYALADVDDLVAVRDEPLISVAYATLKGALAEGYEAYVAAAPEDGGVLGARYQIRQRVQSNVMISPYLRRYFAEDAAIFVYWFYRESLGQAGTNLVDGRDGGANLPTAPDEIVGVRGGLELSTSFIPTE
jgi:hypothetical protein